MKAILAAEALIAIQGRPESLACLKGQADQASAANGSLWSFSVQEEARMSRRPFMYPAMTVSDIAAWLAWGEKWIADEGFRDGYAALMALERL